MAQRQIGASPPCGHARHSLTFGLYSRGVPIKQLADSIQRVNFGPTVAALISSLTTD